MERQSRQQYPWAWLFLSILTLIIIFSEIFSSHSASRMHALGYVEQKIALDQALLQRARQEEIKALSNKKKHSFYSILDESVSSLVDRKGEHAEAAFLYAVMRYEQGYVVAPEEVSILKGSSTRYRSAWMVYTQQDLSVQRLKDAKSLFEGDDLIDRLVRVHIAEKLGDLKARKQIFPLTYWAELAGVTSLYGLLGFIGVWLIIRFRIQVARGKLLAVGHPIVLDEKNDAENRFVGYGQKIFVAVLLGQFLPLLMGEHKLLGLVFSETLAVLFLFFSKWPNDERLWDRLWGKTRWTKQLDQGVGFALANLPIVAAMGIFSYLLQPLFPEISHPATDFLLNAQNPSQFLVMGILVCILAPLFEEVVFRGLLLPCLSYKLHSPLWGLIFTNLIFAAIHPQGVAGWPVLFGVGLVASRAVIQTGSLWPSIFVHAFHNSMVFVLTYVLALHI